MKGKIIREKDENQSEKGRYGDMKKYSPIQVEIMKIQLDDILTSSPVKTLELDYDDDDYENSEHVSWGWIF